MRRIVYLSIVSVGTLAIVSCGGGGSGSDSYSRGGQTNFQKLLNSSTYKGPIGIFNKIQKSDGGQILGLSGSKSAPPLSASLLSAQSSNYNCITDNVTGNQTDADGDGIPVDLIYQFDCTTTNGNKMIQTFGTVQIKDQDDGDPQSGFALCTGTIQGNSCSRDPITSATTSGSGTTNVQLTMDINIVKSGATYSFNNFYINLAVGSSLTLTLNAIGATFVQDSPGDWENGTINGTVTLSVGSGRSAKSFSITSTDLHVSSSCHTPDGGTVQWSTASCPAPSSSYIKELTVNYTGCNTGSYTYTKCDNTTVNGSF